MSSGKKEEKKSVFLANFSVDQGKIPQNLRSRRLDIARMAHRKQHGDAPQKMGPERGWGLAIWLNLTKNKMCLGCPKIMSPLNLKRVEKYLHKKIYTRTSIWKIKYKRLKDIVSILYWQWYLWKSDNPKIVTQTTQYCKLDNLASQISSDACVDQKH